MKQKIDKKNMNWAQAKWAFPKLKPNRDNDRDGVKNQFDCRPLNRKMQHKVKTDKCDHSYKEECEFCEEWESEALDVKKIKGLN